MDLMELIIRGFAALGVVESIVIAFVLYRSNVQ